MDQYNANHSFQLKGSDVYLEKSSTALQGDAEIPSVISDRQDIYVRQDLSNVILQCRNYGCREKFTQASNHDTACRHHSQPPTFHDAKKGWGCCSSKMVYDWDDFEKIEPCKLGRHCAAKPKEKPKAVAAPPPAPVGKSIQDFNKSNPQAATALTSVIKPKA